MVLKRFLKDLNIFLSPVAIPRPYRNTWYGRTTARGTAVVLKRFLKDFNIFLSPMAIPRPYRDTRYRGTRYGSGTLKKKNFF